jgi:hypothetical protein
MFCICCRAVCECAMATTTSTRRLKSPRCALSIRDTLQAILKLADLADSETRAARIMSLEVRIAQAHAPDADAADVFKQNNPWKRADFGVEAPCMDWGRPAVAISVTAAVSAAASCSSWHPIRRADGMRSCYTPSPTIREPTPTPV